MSSPGNIRIGLIGDYNAGVRAHQGIPLALQLAAQSLGSHIEPTWLPTDRILALGDGLSRYNGLWCVPASPYASMDGALHAIRFARENNVPFLGTCGGFQHAVIEYARNVLNIVDADHGESNPDASAKIIAPLSCSLVGVKGKIVFKDGSRIQTIYNTGSSSEGYHCSYGLNPEFRSNLENGKLAFTAFDDQGDVRAMELSGHPFFVATLFQPELSALEGKLHPLIQAFVAETAKSVYDGLRSRRASQLDATMHPPE